MGFPKPFYRWRPHPWHGLEIGPEPPRLVYAFIEITPFDVVKYEVDKTTGYLRVDRPQRTSSLPPTLYGFIPRTLSGPRVGALAATVRQGDGDPLDICVISERPIDHSEVIVPAIVVGGLRMLDGDEADDKIIGILKGDGLWGAVQDISELPEVLIERLRHYFLTYKMVPGEQGDFSIEAVYGCEAAYRVVQAAIEDYDELYGT